MSEFIVRARKDGRGGFRPFGTFTKRQAGAKVDINGKKYKVTKDGRVNIPKKIMEKYGVKGDDNRKRIAISFSTQRASKKRPVHWKEVGAIVSNPGVKSKNLNTGDLPQYEYSQLLDDMDFSDDLLPESDQDYIWS